MTLDTSVLDNDQVENLIKFCPTKEEIEMLKVFFSLVFSFAPYELTCVPNHYFPSTVVSILNGLYFFLSHFRAIVATKKCLGNANR